MKYPTENQMANVCEFYQGMYNQPAPQESVKPRRRRSKKNKGETGEGVLRKRKLSEEQVNILELNFGSEHKLESERKDKLASELGLDPHQVAVWFQNRRARYKSKKMEEEYSKLKAKHDTIVVEKCRLETEVIKLKDQLSHADKEMQRLFERCDGFSSDSPSSSFTMEAMGPLFFEDFRMQGIENIFYEPINYTPQGLDWVNFYV